MMKETRIITAALPFVNNIPHLGNLVGSHLPADIFARYCRIKGYRTIFVGGTDEHGTAIEFAAQKKKITPKKLCDDLYKKHKEIYKWFGISYDNFSRTSRKIHHELVKEFFLKLHKNGFITEKTIKIPYCISCKRGLADRYITGTCPHCKYEQANGDQCEKCATLINPIELIEPHCSVCKSKDIEFRDTKHLFLDLRGVVDRIESWLDGNNQLRKQVKNLAKGWIKQGIEERCITRDLSWGVDVPLKGYESKVFYVWFDNVIGYVSSTVELLGEEAKKLWRNKDVKTYYFLGKDNIPFHTIFWPGQIIAEGSLVLPYNVVGLQYLNFEGQKFSKRKGIGVFADQAIASGIPPDYWRFYLLYALPETKDTDFLADDFKERINKELIGNFGNFVNRTLNFTASNFSSKLAKINVEDEEFEQKVQEKVKKICEAYEKCCLREAQAEILKLSDLGNQYFDKKEPWKNKDENVLGYCCELTRILAVLFSPIIPDASEELFSLLKTKNKKLDLDKSRKEIAKPKILFKKLEDEDLEQFKAAKEFPLHIKLGQIKDVKDHPNADSLYLMQVGFGAEKRQVVAGLKKYFKPTELIGKKILFLVNLKPAKLRGEMSEAMILIAEDKDKNIAFLEVDAKLDVKLGAELGSEVKIDGFTTLTEEITFEQFSKIKLTVREGKVVFENNVLKVGNEKIVAKGVKDGAKLM